MTALKSTGRGGVVTLLDRMRNAEFDVQPECAETDPEIFFPVPEHNYLSKYAKAICTRCPVIESCREMAIRNGEHGIWGGTTEEERRQERRRRRLSDASHRAGEVAA